MGRILVVGPERNMGADRLAELRRVVAHALDEGLTRPSCGLVGGNRLGRDDICFLGREYVFIRLAFLWDFVGLLFVR